MHTCCFTNSCTSDIVEREDHKESLVSGFPFEQEPAPSGFTMLEPTCHVCLPMETIDLVSNKESVDQLESTQVSRNFEIVLSCGDAAAEHSRVAGTPASTPVPLPQHHGSIAEDPSVWRILARLPLDIGARVIAQLSCCLPWQKYRHAYACRIHESDETTQVSRPCWITGEHQVSSGWITEEPAFDSNQAEEVSPGWITGEHQVSSGWITEERQVSLGWVTREQSFKSPLAGSPRSTKSLLAGSPESKLYHSRFAITYDPSIPITQWDLLLTHESFDLYLVTSSLPFGELRARVVLFGKAFSSDITGDGPGEPDTHRPPSTDDELSLIHI